MKFFVPDWDDRVDPGYDFLTDRPTLVRDPYRDDRYAHELMPERTYDGLLMSRMALPGGGPKREAIERVGMRRYLRLPDQLELLGDCGAFGYIAAVDPPYESAEMVAYYDRYGFNYGVSIDHLIVTEFEDQKQHRYDLTLRNAQEFLRLHREGGHTFTPIGAVQGWDPKSYAEAVQIEEKMGYDYIALGGLARSNTETIRQVVQAVSEVVSPHVRLHVFGVARLKLLDFFLEHGIASIDSAAPLRQAWLSATDNYYTVDRTYAAIRIPNASEERPKQTRSRRLKAEQARLLEAQLPLAGVGESLLGRPDVQLADLRRAEKEALQSLRAYDQGTLRLGPALDSIMAYDALLGKRAYARDASRRRELCRVTLEDRPWIKCRCSICRAIGVEVIIFRGNNRNRRRGFHNLRVVRQRIDRASERSMSSRGEDAVSAKQQIGMVV